MTVITTINELNKVLKYFDPDFPRQNLETIESNDCFYVLNETPVEVVIRKESNNDKAH